MKTKITRLLFLCLTMLIVNISAINAISNPLSLTVTVGSSETIKDAVDRALADFTIGGAYDSVYVSVTIPSGYSFNAGNTQTINTTALNSKIAYLNKLIIKGDGTYPSYRTKQFDVFTSLTGLKVLKFVGLELKGVADGTAPANYLVSTPTGVTIDSIVINDCKVNNYTCVINNGTGTTTIKYITLYNSIFSNFSQSFISQGSATCNFYKILIDRSTIYGAPTTNYNLFNIGTSTTLSNVTIQNTTFDNIYLSPTSTKYFMDCRMANTNLAMTNVIFGKTGVGTATNNGIRCGGTATFTNCYKTSDWGLTGYNPSSFSNVTLYSSASSVLFTKVATVNGTTFFNNNADLTIVDLNFAGKNSAGDPRWYPPTLSNPVTLTTSVTPVSSGTVNPSTTTVNAGTSITVTATKAFGYAFKEWQDANNSNAVVSTANPYTFTMNASTSLVAVFDPVTTYDFTVNKEGTGATWGSVTLSPSPTNGKYETGTSVTMTPVSNLVSTFSQWENATTGARTVSITGDVSYSATFTANPFIAAWDFNPTEPRSNRYGDYYFSASNKGVMNFYAVDGNTTNWGGSTISAKTCARRYTALADMSTNCRSFVVVFSAKGYKNIQVNSKITYDNNLVHTMQKLQYSIDGTNFIDLNAVDMSTLTKSSWTAFNGLLPATADNATNVYIRWIGIPGSYVGTVSSETIEGFYLTDVVISGSPVSSNASSGDYIATTSGDISTAANYSVSGGSFGISGTAASPPTTATNIIIPAGITMSNSSEVNCKDLNIKGALTASAPLTVTGNLTITSDADGTGTILDNGNLTVTGTTSVQQYLPDTRNWYVSSPVSKATSPGGFTYYRYDETGQNPSPVAPATAYWVSIAPGADLNKGVGYIALPSVAGSIIAFTAKTGETLNSGNVNITLTHSGATKTGFNLIGNPYPSYLTWTTAFVDDVTNAALIEPTIWVRTNAGDVNSGGNADWKFLTYNGHSGEASPLTTILTGGIIPPMQAFWVKAKAAGTLILDSKLTRTHQSSNLLKAPAAKKTDRQRIRLEISNGSITDETLLYFDGNASNMFDAYDSPKFSETKVVQIYTTVETEKLVMNGLNTMTDNMLIPLGIKTAQAGTFTLKPIQLDNIATDAKVYLMDGQLKTELELNKEYSFTSDASDNTSRFSLLFKTPLQTTQIGNIADKPVFNAYKNANGQLAVTVYEAINATSKVTVSNQLGQKLSERNLAETSTIVSEVLTAGVYFVTVSSNGKSSTQKVILN